MLIPTLSSLALAAIASSRLWTMADRRCSMNFTKKTRFQKKRPFLKARLRLASTAVGCPRRRVSFDYSFNCFTEVKKTMTEEEAE
jgi:hypothetical protein